MFFIVFLLKVMQGINRFEVDGFQCWIDGCQYCCQENVNGYLGIYVGFYVEVDDLG